MIKVIAFTGGGSAGHVLPNIPLIQNLKKQGFSILYFGQKSGIEFDLLKEQQILFIPISSGKLRRYFSLQTLIEPFKVIFGILQSFYYLRKHKPCVIFSKGGFVSFPVVFSAWFNRIPVIIHESDITPGLANRLSFPFAEKICVAFDETKKFLKAHHNKAITTGIPIRSELLHGNKSVGRDLCKFNREAITLLFIGGSLGAKAINDFVYSYMDVLTQTFNIIHITGDKLFKPEVVHANYVSFKYVKEELPHLFAYADIIISRAGASIIFELLELKKPHILIPLSLKASRGDQIVNAHYCQRHFNSVIINNEDISTHLMQSIIAMSKDLQQVQYELSALNLPNSVEKITEIMLAYAT